MYIASYAFNMHAYIPRLIHEEAKGYGLNLAIYLFFRDNLCKSVTNFFQQRLFI